MSNFATPFASTALRRLPNSDEKLNGFPCGPADIKLFNGLWWQIHKELDAIHQAGGIAGTDDTTNTTLLNIQALIDAATGGGGSELYLLMSQARSRNPVFPIILTADYRIICSSPGAGTVRIPGGVSFLHRGFGIEETVETDFATLASKNYHLRWSYADGYSLKDLSDIAYNPTALSESNSIFDSTYDDMLLARVITNSSNVAAITNLANNNKLSASFEKTTKEQHATDWLALPELTGVLNWARTPSILSVTNWSVEATSQVEAAVAVDTSFTRYTVTGRSRGYVVTAGNPTPYISGTLSVTLGA